MFICRKSGCKKIISDTGFCKEHVGTYSKDHDKSRKSSRERGYDSRWRKARLQFLAHNPLCVECANHGITKPANVVDHIVPHRGNEELFDDQSNWQSLCKMHHDQKTRRGE